ncbi:MAG: VIM family subclass B1 metallo-beta-lactamase [Pseudoalteromonas sp.]|uniref:subclass B1 metallo-beta-lactamase n=1 Tax=Pseudoalteromonas sp. TaxID=53249 RepID=UPI000C8C0BE4|nr:subclass B1 metallo-beta-lactamase [Pseudoalteromonas sp.]MAD03811.1 VIM family subclass B1 metallo-beta-lactamase [Pseudoalteromonas sp.]|tara:strand:+ start:26041 stop:26790 length:750 start_codon:yes stop_codon:yes gene_type:complete
MVKFRIFGSFIFFLLIYSFQVSAQENRPNQVSITQLADGVWLHTSYYTYPNGTEFPSNGLIVKEGDSLTLIDTAWGELLTLDLLEAISLEIKLPVSKAFVTHAHGDRAAGIDVLESKGINVFAHPLTAQLTIEQGAAVPNNIIKELRVADSVVKFGSLELFFPGPGHAMDNVMAWLPEKRILFGGCAVRSLQSSSVGNLVHGDIHSWLNITKQLKRKFKSAVIVVPGHGAVGGYDLLSHTEKLITDHLK